MTIALLLVLLAPWPLAHVHQAIEPSTRLHVRAEAVRAVTCVADSDVVRVDVDIQLLLSNRGDRALIVPAYQTLFGFRTATTPEALRTAEWGSITTMLGRDPAARSRPPIPDTPDSRFVVLRPGEARELQVHAKLPILIKDVSEVISAEVSTGALYDMTPREWREAERKWRGVGELLTESLESGGFRLPVTTEAQREACGER
jgi:hypothetical protein